MKKILFLLFTLPLFSLNAQTVLSEFGGSMKVTSNPVASGANYTMTVSNFVGTSKFAGVNWQFTDMKTDSVGSTKDAIYNSSLSRFVLISRAGNTITFKDSDAAFGSILPSLGDVLMVSRETMSSGGYYVGSVPQNGDGAGGAISGISTEFAAGVRVHYDKIARLINATSVQTAVEITSATTYPLVAPTKIGNEVVIVNGQDTTVGKWNGKFFQTDFVYGTTEPVIEAGLISNRKAIWRQEYIGLSTKKHVINYVVRGNRWEKQYPTTPFDFDAKGDSLTDDTNAFRDMFDFLNYSGGRDKNIDKVIIPKGKFRVTGLLTGGYGYYLNRDIEVIGEEGAIIINESAVNPFQFNNVVDFEISPTTTVLRNTNYIISTNPKKPNVGDLVVIQDVSDRVLASWTYTTNDVSRVLKLNGDTIFIEKKLNFDYATATAKVQFSTPRNVKFSGVEFRNYKTANVSGGITVQRTVNSVIENVTVDNRSGIDADQVGITSTYNVNASINNSLIKNYFYAVAVDGGHKITCDKITAIGCLGGIISPAIFADDVVGTNLVGYMSNLDAHPSFNITYKNVQMYGGIIKMEGWNQHLENVDVFTRDSAEHLFASYYSPFNSQTKFDYLWTSCENSVVNVKCLAKSKNSTFSLPFQASAVRSKKTTLTNLTVNHLKADRYAKSVIVNGGSFGLIQHYDSTYYRDILFDGLITPNWSDGFIHTIGGYYLSMDNITTSNAANKTLFIKGVEGDGITIANSNIQGIYGITPRGETMPKARIINSRLNNFGTKTLSDVTFIGCTTDGTVKNTNLEHLDDPQWFTLSSNVYNKSGFEVENSASGGTAYLKLKGQTANASFDVFNNGVANFENTRDDIGRFNFWQTNGGIRKNVMTLYDNNNLGINETAPQYKLDVNAMLGGNGNPIRVQGLIEGLFTDSLVTSANGVFKRMSLAGLGAASIIKSLNTVVIIPTITGMGTTGTVSVTVTGATVGMQVSASPRTNVMTSGVSAPLVYVSAANTVTFSFSGLTVGTNGNISSNWDITIIK